MEEIFFIDSEGNKISSDKIFSHVALANAILQKRKELEEEYKQSGERDPVDFLISKKGYIKISNQGYYRKCVYSSIKISEKQKNLISYYCEEGYSLDDIDFKKYLERAR